MAELVYAHDSKSCGFIPCGFDSHHAHKHDSVSPIKTAKEPFKNIGSNHILNFGGKKIFNMTNQQSISCNIAIYPPGAISKKAINISRKLKNKRGLFVLDGNNYYPHITIYMTEFPKKNIKSVKAVLRDIAVKTKPFLIKADRYRQSKDGSVDMGFKRTKEILVLHKKVIQFINPLREGLIRPKDSARFKQFSKQKQKNLRSYGYDNVSSQFIPHLTFTKLEYPNKKILDTLSMLDFSFLVKEIGLFQSAEHGTCRKLIARFRLS